MPETYLDQLTLELRRREVPGDRIGEVLAEVEAHVAESGDPAADTFGPPGEYAASVAAALRPVPATTGEPRWRQYARLYALGLGAFLVARFVLLLTFEPLSPVLTVGTIAATALMSLAAMVVVRRLMRPEPGGHVTTGLIIAATTAVPLVIAVLPLQQTVPSLPWPSLLPIGLALVALGLGGLRVDRVIDPRDGRNRYGLSRRTLALLVGVPVGVLALAGLAGLLLG